jgi:aryl-alcohol dehydrogenase-like predicted oxidoreductase
LKQLVSELMFLPWLHLTDLIKFKQMKYRRLGKTGIHVSEISLGTNQVGGRSIFSNSVADRILNTAIDAGINFIDTADVYNFGYSERAVGRVIRSRKERVYVATKIGRQLHPHISLVYKPGALRKFVEESLKNMDLECLDLIQLHSPPREVYYRPEIFGLFDTLKQEGKILHFGVCVEKVEEALKAIEYPNVSTIQVVFNMFRQQPAELLFKEAKKKDVGIIARVPLASGMLSGDSSKKTFFTKENQLGFTTESAAFIRGEAFSGIDFETGKKATQQLRKAFAGLSLEAIALKWILMFEEVSCTIPGVSGTKQLYSNLKALDLPDLSSAQMDAVKMVYDEYIKNHIRW